MTRRFLSLRNLTILSMLLIPFMHGALHILFSAAVLNISAILFYLLMTMFCLRKLNDKGECICKTTD
jgi:hypothetical protein